MSAKKQKDSSKKAKDLNVIEKKDNNIKKPNSTEVVEVKKEAAPKSNVSVIRSDAKIFKVLYKSLMWVLLIVVPFIAIDYFVQFLNNEYSSAVVNGTRISQSSLDRRLEQVAGKQMLTQLINEELIRQEASKENVKITDKQVDDRVSLIIKARFFGDREGFEQALESSGITMDDYRGYTAIDLMAEAILVPEKDIKDSDLEKYFEDNKADIYQGEDVDFKSKKDEIKQYYVISTAEGKRDAWLTELATKAKIQNNLEEKGSYDFLKVTRNIITNIKSNYKDQTDTKK